MTNGFQWRRVAALTAASTMFFVAFVLQRRVPLLGYADLGFHELGHLLTIPFGRTVSFLMGSGTQVLVPMGLAAYFWLRSRDEVAAGLMAVWAATSMQDASVYIADAPYQRLPLIGGHHDWAYLMSHWGILSESGDYAGLVFFCGVAVGIAGIVLIAWTPGSILFERLRHVWRRFQAKDLPVRRTRTYRQPWDRIDR